MLLTSQALPSKRLFTVDEYHRMSEIGIISSTDKHPSPGDIFWIIEVADATLQFDLRRKSLVYASANIQEYWVVNAIAQEIHVFRGLADGAYTKQDVYTKNGIVRPLAFMKIGVFLNKFFP